MQYRKATHHDTPALVALWQQVFGDDVGLITNCLQLFAGQGNVYVAQNSQGVCAQLLAVPCNIKECKGFYLYALATNPAVQGQGVMSALMQYAETQFTQSDAQFCALIPANPPLFAFYAKRGYTQQTRLCHFRVYNNELAASPIKPTVGQISPQMFAALRNKHIPAPFMAFDAQRYAMVLDDIEAQGGGTVYCNNGYALFLPTQNDVLIPEIFADDELGMAALLRAVFKQTKAQSLQVTAAPQQAFAAPLGPGGQQPFAMLKPLQGWVPAQNLYIRMALEEFT
ncbi:GNAT family N-acetyltransferase [Ruminococcaceae bacterium OttesenSCG-928-A16]|nr:GNAT family N-acetyltransferase [Ruminococcaceae bacterium OttesenSCG-928-A16]